ncbi:MAG: capsule assembly Wzi family protein [Candidatus Eisenbacteria bacterium]
MRTNSFARRAAVLAAVALALAGAAGTPHAATHALESIPVESPVYRMVDALVTSYGFAGAFHSTRPWDRADLGRFLDQLVTDRPAAADDPLVVRLRRELGGAGGPGGWDALVALEDERSSLEVSPYVRADYSEDRAHHEVVRDFRGGVQASLAMGEHLLAWADVYAGTSSPGGHGNPVESRHFGLVEGVQVNSWFDRATVAWRGSWGRVQAGHTWLRWGPGAWGTMALSDAAPAFDLAEARVALPGPAQFAWFVASLDPVTQSYLAGHRVELCVGNRLDVAFSELARFDGTASVPGYLLGITPYSLLEKRLLHGTAADDDSTNRWAKNNVMWSADAAWRWKPGVRLYGEIAVDDISFSSEPRPDALAWQLGLDARRVRGNAAWSFRGEYARVYRFTYSVYHHHDFEFAGLPTGFPLGPDVDRTRARVERRASPEWAFGLEGTYTRKGESTLGDAYTPGTPVPNNLVLSGVPERDARAALTADWSPAPGLAAGVTAGWARVTALGHAEGADESAPFGSTRFTLRW